MNIGWCEVMHEEIAADDVERAIGERQSKSIRGDGSPVAIEVSASPVEQGDLQFPIRSQPASNLRWNIAGACADLEQRKGMARNSSGGAANEILAGPNPAAELVEHLQVTQGSGHFLRSAVIGVQKFDAGTAFHGKSRITPQTEWG